ncbi:MAG: hypothetical protein K9L70_03105 [Thiohalocapsa sp.]|nr:hypothetical protein [Thiohalocapsa sp.]MCF7992963.1 hypothetical protein [Thiohalocapsa sp.]
MERYNIVFAGELLGTSSAQQARQKLQALFKLDDARTAQLFSGQRVTVKRDVDLETAARYQDAFRAAGARAIIETASDLSESPTNVDHMSGSSTKADGDWGLAPPGAMLEEIEDRRPRISPDTSGLALVAGTNWSLEDCEPPPAPTAVPRTDHLTLEPAFEKQPKGSE